MDESNLFCRIDTIFVDALRGKDRVYQEAWYWLSLDSLLLTCFNFIPSMDK